MAENNNAEKAAEDIAADKTPAEKKAKSKSKINKRKLKYGSVAVAITVVVIAIVVLINVVLNMASDKVNMSLDLTVNGNFEISQQTIDYLATVKEPVDIVCLSNELTFQTAVYIYYKQAYEVLKKYSIYSDKVSLTFVDMVENPTYAERYKQTYKGEINPYSIVVENKNNGRIKVMDIMDLYNTETKIDYSTFSYQQVPVSSKAEQQLTSAIMYVTDPDPIKAVFFTGETVGASYDNVKKLLDANGYEVSEIDPMSEPIPADADIIVINAPLNDYDPDLTDAIYDYLDNGGKLGRSLIYIADFGQKRTANIDALLAEWGIRVEEAIVAESDANNLAMKDLTVIKDYIEPNEYSVNVAQPSLAVIDYQSRPITLLFDNKDSRSTMSLLKTKETAFLLNEEVQKEIKAGNDPKFESLNTMALGRRFTFDENNRQVFSSVLVIGSSKTLDEQLTETTYYNNGDYFISAVNTMAGKTGGISIVAKDLGSDTFEMDQALVSRYFIIFIIGVPLAVLFIGGFVLFKRRGK